MKKILSFALALVMGLSIVACTKAGGDKKSEGVMTYDEYVAAAVDSKVVIETYVQAKQSWWDNKATLYTQDKDGGYFLYEMPCTQEEYDKLIPGTKIKVSGSKAEWSGEIEVVDMTYEVVKGDTYVAEPVDLTSKLASEDLVNYQNMLASFKGLTVENIEYKNGQPGDDIYVTLGLDGKSYSFCVEFYLTGADTDVYKTVGTLKAGDVVDVEGFVYWYNGVNPHITSIKVAG